MATKIQPETEMKKRTAANRKTTTKTAGKSVVKKVAAKPAVRKAVQKAATPKKTATKKPAPKAKAATKTAAKKNTTKKPALKAKGGTKSSVKKTTVRLEDKSEKNVDQSRTVGRAKGAKDAKSEKAGSKPTAEEVNDAPVIDSVDASVKKLIESAKERGYVTYDDLNKALPPGDTSADQMEDTMAQLSELGINLIENDDSADMDDDDANGEGAKATANGKAANDDNQDLGRTDDPVRM